MLQIFHMPRSRSMRVIWLAEEMGLPYELKPETFGQPSAEFLAASATGAFPAIREGEVVMGESTAIMQYLMETHGPTPLALKAGSPRFADYLQFLTFGEASMAAYLNPAFMTMFTAPEEEKQNYTVEAIKRMFKGRLAAVERQLDGGDYMAGGFTAADISVGYALRMGGGLGLNADYTQPVQDYVARLEARPAFQAAAAK